MFACGRCIPSASIDVAHLLKCNNTRLNSDYEINLLKGNRGSAWVKKKRNRPYFQLPNYKFKILLYVNLFRNLVQYSPLSSASWVDGQKKKDELVNKTVKNIKFGRKIVYDLINLVYNDTIQNSCILKLLLFTSILFDILGYVLSQNF